MSVLDKFLNAMKMDDDDYDDYDDDDYLDDDEEEVAPRKAAEPEPAKAASKVTPMRQSSRARTTASGMEVCLIKPTSVDDAREIIDTLLANRTVLLNLEGLDVGIAQRIIDFTSGATYALSGNFQKVSQFIFIITPKTVDISGDVPEGVLAGAFDVPSVNKTFPRVDR